MKIKPFIIFNFLSISLSSCITVAPKRLENDSYRIISPNEFEFAIVEIGEDLSRFHSEKNIYLFATWCAPCLSEIKYGKKYDSSNTHFVSTNYNIDAIANALPLKTDTLYILSNKYYGNIEKEKIKKFASHLLLEESLLEGLPQLFQFSNHKFIRISL